VRAEKLVHRANQVAAYFAAYPHDEAVSGVADHFNKFWERRLRDELRRILDEPGLHVLVKEAGPRLRA
jgi:formate dehydrogenase subunit delta